MSLREGKMNKDFDWSVIYLFEVAKESNERTIYDAAKKLYDFSSS